jgi:hypothetical protein
MAKEISPDYRLRDPHKAVGQCDGYFSPENRQPHGPMRPGKTSQDRMPVDKRPRVQAAKKRSNK